MKKKKHYLSYPDEERAVWLYNFAAKLPGAVATKYGITAAEVADMTASAVYFDLIVKFRKQHEEYVKSLTAHRTAIRDGLTPGSTLSAITPPSVPVPAIGTVQPGIFRRVAGIVKRIKGGAYTIADGENLGIIGEEAEALDLAVIKPVISLQLIAGQPEIIWEKGLLTSLEIEVDRGNGWEFLTIDTNPNYRDTFVLPKAGHAVIYKYRAIFRLNDERVGQWSDVVSIAIAG